MVIGRKAIFYIIAGISGLAILALSLRVFVESTYRKQIPEIPEFSGLSVPLKEQISDASIKANRRPKADNIGTLGMVYHSSMYYDKASLCYGLAIKRNRKEWLWDYYLGCLSREMGDPVAAIKNFREVTRKNPEIFLAWYYKAESYQKAGKSDSAELSFKYIISRMDKNTIVKTPTRYDYFPLVTYAMYDLARIYMNTGRNDLAEKTLKDIIDYQLAFGPAYRLLGNVYSINGNESLSKHYLVRANDLVENPSPVDTLIDRISLMSRSDMYLLKRIDETETNIFPEYALELVKHSLIYFPENNYLVAKAIRLFLIRDMGKQALPYLSQHINYFKNDIVELKNVGDILYNKGFYPEAINYYSSALKLKPSDSQVESCLVVSLLRDGKKEQARNMVDEMVEKYKTNPSILADGVTLLLNLGEKEKAALWLSRLKKLSPSLPKGQQLTGMIAEQDGNLKEAISDYSLAFNGDPSDLTTARLLGNLLIRQKLWGKAIIHFRKALESHPNEPYLLERLGTLLVTCNDPKLRDIDQGKDLCERAFINTDSRSMTLISAGRSLAIAYILLGDRVNATNVIKKTINIARGEHLPAAYIDDLKNLLKQFNITN